MKLSGCYVKSEQARLLRFQNPELAVLSTKNWNCQNHEFWRALAVGEFWLCPRFPSTLFSVLPDSHYPVFLNWQFWFSVFLQLATLICEKKWNQRIENESRFRPTGIRICSLNHFWNRGLSTWAIYSNLESCSSFFFEACLSLFGAKSESESGLQVGPSFSKILKWVLVPENYFFRALAAAQAVTFSKFWLRFQRIILSGSSFGSTKFFFELWLRFSWKMVGSEVRLQLWLWVPVLYTKTQIFAPPQ